MLVWPPICALFLAALSVTELGGASTCDQKVFGAGNDGLSAAPSYQRAKRIAVIGAGPGGTSTAYFLSKAQQQLQNAGMGGQGFEITLFERDERVGGRTAVVHPYDNEQLPAVELGASIFADVNKNLKRAAEVRGVRQRTSTVCEG